MYASLVQRMLLVVALGGLIHAELMDSGLMQDRAERKLANLRDELIEAMKKSRAGAKTVQEPGPTEVLEGLNKEAESPKEEQVQDSNKTDRLQETQMIEQEAQKEEKLQELEKEEIGEGDQTVKSAEKVESHETQEEQHNELGKQGFSLEPETEQEAKEQIENDQTNVKNTDVSEDVNGDQDSEGKDVVDHRSDNKLDGADVTDEIFFVSAGLVDEIKAVCSIDIEAIFKSFAPATLSQVNDGHAKLLSATKQLSDLLASKGGFANDLEAFLNSKEYHDSKVVENINKTFKHMDKTLSSVDKQLFCAEAQLIAARLQMALYGGNGFANGFLCNKVFVELVRHELNATKVLKAVAENENFVKNCTKSLAADIACFEKELAAFNQVIPTNPFKETNPLQLAAFSIDFYIHYGVILLYHRVMLELEAEIVTICAADDNEDENDVSKKTLEAEDEDTESLTDQLQKLLKKLNEVSAKKKAAESALDERTKSNEQSIEVRKESQMNKPSLRQKIALKNSHYRERDV